MEQTHTRNELKRCKCNFFSNRRIAPCNRVPRQLAFCYCAQRWTKPQFCNDRSNLQPPLHSVTSLQQNATQFFPSVIKRISPVTVQVAQITLHGVSPHLGSYYKTYFQPGCVASCWKKIARVVTGAFPLSSRSSFRETLIDVELLRKSQDSRCHKVS